MKIVIVILFLWRMLLAEDEVKSLSVETYTSIQAVQKLIETSSYTMALQRLENLNQEELEAIDSAYVYLYFGYIYSLEASYEKAAVSYEKALSLKVLNTTQIHQLQTSLYQIYMTREAYDKALHVADRLLEKEDDKAKYYIYKANAHLALNDFDACSNDIKNALHVEPKGKERWFSMLYYCQFELKAYTEAIESVKALLDFQPSKREYWLYLATLHTLLHQYESAFVDLELANSATVLEEVSLYKQLIYNLRYYKMPYEAARLLHVSLDKKRVPLNEENVELLGDCYYEAKELDDAISSYKEAADFNKSSTLYFKIAQLYAQEKQYIEVIHFSELSSKSNADESYFLMAQAYYELARYDEAIRTFKKLLSSSYDKEAKKWIRYIKTLAL